MLGFDDRSTSITRHSFRVSFGLGFRSFPPLYTSLFDGKVPRARPDSAFAELLPSGQALQRQVADSFSHAAQLR